MSYADNRHIFQASLKLIVRRSKEYMSQGAVASETGAYRESDGSLFYDKKTCDRTLIEINNEAAQLLNSSPVYSLGAYNGLDAEYVKLLESFIDLLHKDKVEIVFMLPPYHPHVYKSLQSSCQSVVNAETYFRALAKRKGVRLLGSYNPGKLNLREVDFYDGMHPKRETVQKIFQSE